MYNQPNNSNLCKLWKQQNQIKSHSKNHRKQVCTISQYYSIFQNFQQLYAEILHKNKTIIVWNISNYNNIKSRNQKLIIK